MQNLGVFLVSMKQDSKRREILKQNFKTFYDEFNIIQAINGKELLADLYYKKSFKTSLDLKRLMSPGELGCTLSHIEALKAFLDSSFEFGLILEDDVIGCNQEIEKIKNLEIKQDFVLICGAQDGLGSQKYIYGKKVFKDLFEVCKFSYPHIYRTCCYVVTKNSASKILKYQEANHDLADRWDKILKNSDLKLYFADIFSHPKDLENSHIEKDRQNAKPSFFKKLFSKWIFVKIYSILGIICLRILGYKRVVK